MPCDQSAVMSTTFAKFHPNLVVGGTYSGQIVLWDNRSNKRTPMQRTPLSATAHTVMVTCHGHMVRVKGYTPGRTCYAVCMCACACTHARVLSRVFLVSCASLDKLLIALY